MSVSHSTAQEPDPSAAEPPPSELAAAFYTKLPFFDGNQPSAPAHLLLMAGVRGFSHVFNVPLENDDKGRLRPKRGIWMSAFVRSMERDDWATTWLRLARIALQREMAVPETLAAVERLEEIGFERPLMRAFADILETV